MSDDLEWRSYAEDTEATFNLYTPPPRLPRPARAAALRDVETLLGRIMYSGVLHGDRALWLRPSDQPGKANPELCSDLAALIVDRVLGAEQDGAS